MEEKDFLTDAEMAQLEAEQASGPKPIAPDFLSDAEMAEYERQPGNLPKTPGFIDRALGLVKSTAIPNPILQATGMKPAMDAINAGNMMSETIYDVTGSQSVADKFSSKPWVGDPQSGNFLSRAAGKYGPSNRGAVEFGLKTAYNPLTYIGAGAASGGSKVAGKAAGALEGVKGVASRGAKGFARKALGKGKQTLGWFAEPFQETGKIRAGKAIGMADIEQKAAAETSKITRTGAMRKNVVQKLYGDEPMASLESNKNYLARTVEKSADKEALALQGDLPKLYGKRTGEFGDELGRLVGKDPINVPASEVNPQLERSLLEHGVLKYNESGHIVPARAPIGPSETKVYNMYNNFKQGLIDNPEITVDASDLIKSQSSMKVPFGKAFKGPDKLMGSVKQHISSALEPYVPGLKALRTRFKPYLEGKYQSIKELNPFSTEYETGKATRFLERHFKGETMPDEKRLVSFMEAELKRELSKTGKSAGNRLQQIGQEKSLIKRKLEDELAKIDDAIEMVKSNITSKKITDQKVLEKEIDEALRKNNLQKWIRGGVGLALAKVIKNQTIGRVTSMLARKPDGYSD